MRYQVGGCVRDQVMGIAPRDHDWLHVGVSGEELEALGYRPTGKDFVVYLHPETRDEVSITRDDLMEPELGLSTLEADLVSRDLTINAMAMTPEGEVVDPWGGRRDIAKRILRHCHAKTFRRDPVRALRLARFAARYGDTWSVAPETISLIRAMAEEGAFDDLVPERVWQEMEKALAEPSPWLFFEWLEVLQVLPVIMPELASLRGVPQPAVHHPEIDTFVHTMLVLRRAAELSGDPVLRFAALTHDLGKGVTPPKYWPSHHGHERAGALIIERQLADRLKLPNRYRRAAYLVAEYHTKVHTIQQLTARKLLETLKALGLGRDYTVISLVADACLADAQGRTGFEHVAYPQARYLVLAAEAVGKVTWREVASAEGLDASEVAAKKIPDLIHRHEIKKLKRFMRRMRAYPYLLEKESPWSQAPSADGMLNRL